MKILIMYYSYSGNTRAVAKMLQEELSCDVAEVEMTEPYTGDPDAVAAQGKEEVTNGFRPRISPLGIAFAEYDTVLLGTPVWWYTFAPAMRTAIMSFNWVGKTVYPFITDGGWPGSTLRDIKLHCRRADVRAGLDVRFDEAQMKTPAEEIRQWAESILTTQD